MSKTIQEEFDEWLRRDQTVHPELKNLLLDPKRNTVTQRHLITINSSEKIIMGEIPGELKAEAQSRFDRARQAIREFRGGFHSSEWMYARSVSEEEKAEIISELTQVVMHIKNSQRTNSSSVS
jgi:hypothetical protein